MAYRDRLSTGMTQAEVLDILGDPEHVEVGEVTTEWKWDRLIDDDGTELKGRIAFRGDTATSLSFATPNAPEIKLIISI